MSTMKLGKDGRYRDSKGRDFSLAEFEAYLKKRLEEIRNKK